MITKPTIKLLPPTEKSEQRIQLERRIADFMGTVRDINMLGKQIGRTCLAIDLVADLTALICYADTPAFEEITGITAKNRVVK